MNTTNPSAENIRYYQMVKCIYFSVKKAKRAHCFGRRIKIVTEKNGVEYKKLENLENFKAFRKRKTNWS